jgi:hypothetical protein
MGSPPESEALGEGKREEGSMNPLPKDKRRLIRLICENGGTCSRVSGTGEVRVEHPASQRRVKTSHWARDDRPSKELQLLAKEVLRLDDSN